jgi:hypothetical protein
VKARRGHFQVVGIADPRHVPAVRQKAGGDIFAKSNLRLDINLRLGNHCFSSQRVARKPPKDI